MRRCCESTSAALLCDSTALQIGCAIGAPVGSWSPSLPASPDRLRRRLCARRLWKLAEPPNTLNELRRIGGEAWSPQQLARFVKLNNRDGIRTRNHSRAK